MNDISTPFGPMPGPVPDDVRDPGNTGINVSFKYAPGTKVETIYGEIGFIESVCMQRGGRILYEVQIDLRTSDWLLEDQFKLTNR